MKSILARCLSLLLWIAWPVLGADDVVISEIMYNTPSANPAEEWIELHNRGTNAVNLNGWRFSNGIEFTFSNVTLLPGGYLVVAADVTSFSGIYPSVTNVIGGWMGTLSNNGEDIDLDDASGERADSVNYATDGDWGTRRRGPFLAGTRGWEWFADHDGLGKSLELRSAALSNNHGQNWGPSVPVGGTPGAVNSLAASNLAPLILDGTHFPTVPASSNAATISARILDEGTNGIVAFVWHRTFSDPFAPVQMFDDGLHNDGAAGDGVFAATLPAQLNETVVEFYIMATDSASNSRTWPAPVLDEFGNPAQAANAIYQVDDSAYTGTQPFYRIIMTEAERQQFEFINRQSDAQMNCTFITIDGVSTEVRYLCGVRIRGAGSRGRNPPNYRLNLPNDKLWKDVDEINLNTQYTHAQLVGSAVAERAGLPVAHARVVQVRVNARNLANAGLPQFGSYAALEVLNADWAEEHIPTDPDGNMYRASIGAHTADLNYLGTSPNSYMSAGYTKTSNASENDWSDLINLTFVLNNTPDVNYTAAVSQVVNVREWMKYFAVLVLMEYSETSLGSGEGDDYSMYRGNVDPRFLLLAHDFDTIFGQGDTGGNINESIFIAADASDQPAVARFLTWQDFVPLYYAELNHLLNTTFSEQELSPLFDRLLTGLVPQGTIDSMKAFATARNNYVRSQIRLNLTINSTGLPVVNGLLRATNSTVALSGFGNVIETRSIRVRGALANWNPVNGAWSVPAVNLNPGINRVLVQAFDANGNEFARTNLDLWYDDGRLVSLPSAFTVDTTLTAAGGPYQITAAVTVPANVTLTIAPGTTIYFEQGYSINVSGRLVAEGTDTQRIRLTHLPGGSETWSGIRFNNSTGDNRIAYVDFEYASAGDPIVLVNSTLLVDNVTWAFTTRTIIDLNNSSLICRNSVFPMIANNETIHGTGMPPNGYVIIERNRFGGTTGYSDIIDFTGGQRPGPILQVLDNIFDGGSDDALDLDSTDAHIEGNVFMHIHQDAPRDSASFAIATDFGSEITVVRNIFYDNDHAVLLKNGAFLTAHNNTIVGSTIAAIAFDETNRVVDPGLGAYLEGNILWNNAALFEHLYFNHPTETNTVLTVNRSLMQGTNQPGIGNLNLDPLFVDSTNDFHLQAGSPAIGTGPNGLDMGAYVPKGASISGEPPSPTPLTSATLTVGGPGITHYRYRLNQQGGTNNGPYSSEISVTNNPIVLSGLSNGTYVVEVVGKNSAGVWQDFTNATASRAWQVNNTLSFLRINELLARNVLSVIVGGENPDLVELYNGGAAMVDLSGMGLTDDLAEPFKFVFPVGTTIGAGQYRILYADNAPGAFHLGFALDQAGDELYLHSAGGSLLDSVAFGPQVADFSIGRLADGNWALTRPTFGSVNVPQPAGDPRVLKINEWLAHGVTLYQDDFVELYNPLPAPVNLSGSYLTDAPQGSPARHQMPPLSFVAPNGFLLLIASGEPSNGTSHLNFKLSPNQGEIGLFAPDLSLIDCIVYGPQSTDIAEGRIPNGSATFGFIDPPTPGGPNPAFISTTVVSNIVISIFGVTNQAWRYEASGIICDNSWLQPGYDDSGWSNGFGLFGFETTPAVYPFPFNSFIAPNQSGGPTTAYFRTRFVWTNGPGWQLVATNYLDDGAAFYINGSEVAPRVRLSDGANCFTFANNQMSEGQAEIVNLGSPANGTNILQVELHQGFDSSDDVFGMALSAVRTVTNTIFQTVVLNEVMANNRSIIPPGGTGSTNITDWVELYNPSVSTINLTGMSLSDDIAAPGRWVFPPGTTIPSRGYRVVRFDSASPATTNVGVAIPNTGFGLRAGGDEVYLFDTPARGGGLINSVVFGLQAADFSIGRIPNGAGPWELNLPTPGSVNIIASLGTPATLRINEWLANPSGNDEDYIELYNPNPQPVKLSGLFLTDNLSAATRNQHKIAPLSFIGVGSEGFALFTADSDTQGRADHVNFGLRAQGEAIGLYSPSTVNPNLAGVEIDSLTFEAQLNGVSEGRFPDGSATIVRFPGTTTPGRSNIRALTEIVISEVLTHTDDPLEDAIELQNVSNAAINISGWYLSDARNDPKKYRIPEGTVIQPGGFVVFYEYQFNANPFPNIYPSFSLSSVHGDDVYLSTADAAGNLTGFRAGADFGAAENGVSFGRYQTSVEVDFTPLTQRTFGVDSPATLQEFRTGAGLSNAYPKVGPIVINEIMYHPPDIGTNENTVDEFIELRNISAATVFLFHTNYPANTWRLRDAVDFDFPPGIALAPNDFLLVVSFDPNTNATALTAFRARYSVSTNVPVLGPYEGRLANDGENVELYKPDAPVLSGPETGFVPYLQVDKVKYSDAAPWPTAADGNTNGIGVSLQRRAGSDYGNDPVNWLAGNPTAGVANGPAVAALPAITLQPESRTVPAGTLVTFSVAATGAAPLRYQWRFNGLNIAGATNTSFTVNSAQFNNSGHYTVLANNSVGAALSATAVLTVQAPPAITQQPQSRAVVRGGTAIFTVVAQGTAPLTYQWRKEGTDLPGATSATLVVTNVQPENEGNYTVVVTNLFGSVTSQVAQLGISTIPVIVMGPQSTNVFVGATVTFNVIANGSPPLLYQWRFNNVNISGQTNASLVLSNVQVTHSGNYAVFVTNTVGGVLSPNATLIVTIPPVVSILASDAMAGEQNTNTGTFTVSRTGSTSFSLTVDFSVSGSAIPDSDYARLPNFVIIPSGAAQTTLTVTPVDELMLEGDETVIVTLTNTAAYVVGSPASATVTILDNDNIAPSVTLTNPVDGAVFVPPSPIVLAATASDSDGSVARVEFYYHATGGAGPVKIGEAASAPFVFTWTNAPSGNLVLTAVAVDNLGSTGVSAPVNINVNSSPIVAIISPSNGATFTAPANIALTASASDAEGSVTNVEFYAGTNLIGATSTATAGPLKADYRFQNSLATSVGSAPALTNLGANTFITANVDGASRTVLRFPLNNGVALGQASSVIPNNVYTIVILFSFDIVNSWRRVIDFKNAAFDTGAYSLDGGLQFYPDTPAGPTGSIRSNTFVQVVLTRDSSRNVTGYVNGVQQFSFIDTADNGALNAANVLRFFRDDGTEASAGSIARLRIYEVALSAAQVDALDRLPTGGPAAIFYSVNWNNVPAGSYVLTARAADNHGSVGVSPPVNITVNVPPLGFADMFANRGLISGYTNTITGNNAAYTWEPGEPRHDVQVISTNHRSAWITWTAPGSGLCTIDTVGSSFDTVMAVYTNSPPSVQSVSNLVRVASNDDDGANLYSRLTFGAIGGVAYHIVVDGYGSGVGGSIVIHLDLPNQSPVITTQPQSQIVNQGGTASFNVVAIGQGPFSYQWFFNGTSINGATSSTLTIGNVRSTNDGPYTVMVSNSSGSTASAAATLTVRVPPSIAIHPQPQVVNPGSNVTFAVAVNGTAPFSYQWRFNGANVGGETGSSFTRNNVQHTNAGLYSVTVANAAGSAISQGAGLVVRPQIMSAQRLTNGIFRLIYHGTPGRNYSIEWSGTLTNWSSFISISNSAVSAQYQDTNAPSLGNRSYRIRLLP